jgi:hypothetical protein
MTFALVLLKGQSPIPQTFYCKPCGVAVTEAISESDQIGSPSQEWGLGTTG